MAKYFLIIIVVLLGSTVGYLAWDRQDKISAQEHTKNFKAKFLK